MTEETVTITKKRYEELLDHAFKLSCLEAGGVDNWEWYSDSLREHGYFEEDEDE